MKIRDLVEKGYNVSAIHKELGKVVARETIRKFCKNNGIGVSLRIQSETLVKKQKFIDFLPNAINLKQAQIYSGVGYDLARAWAAEAGYENLLKSRKEAALDKVLTNKEVLMRLPFNCINYIVLGFENGKYKIQAPDGFIFYKSSGHISQGDPRKR